MQPLRLRHALIALALAAGLTGAGLHGQTVRTFVVPGLPGYPAFPSNNIPFAGVPMRYQQIYKAADISGSIRPARIKGVNFKLATSGQQGQLVTMDLAIAHAAPNVSTVFASNIRSDRLQILTGQGVQLPSPSVAGFNLPISFGTQEFVWNGVDDIVLDIKILSNTNNSQSFLYHFESVSSAFSSVTRLYAPGATSTTATLLQQGVGIVTQFSYVDGVNLPFSQGCPGTGNFSPVAGAVGQPVVANANFQFLLTRAFPQTGVVLILGYSRSMWGSVPLPLDLTGAGAPGCFLLTNPLLFYPGVSLGGSPGNGTATIPFPIPPITAYIGVQLVTQWLVIDAVNPAGFVMSSGLVTVIG